MGISAWGRCPLLNYTPSGFWELERRLTRHTDQMLAPRKEQKEIVFIFFGAMACARYFIYVIFFSLITTHHPTHQPTHHPTHHPTQGVRRPRNLFPHWFNLETLKVEQIRHIGWAGATRAARELLKNDLCFFRFTKGSELPAWQIWQLDVCLMASLSQLAALNLTSFQEVDILILRILH